MDVNKVIIMGNVGRDPAIKTWDNGDLQASFSVATTRRWTSKDGQKQEFTEWHNVVVKEPRLAEIAQKYVSKGSRVFIEGEVATRKYTKDGIEKYVTEIIVPRFKGVLNLEGNKNDSGNGAATPADTSNIDDEIPF